VKTRLLKISDIVTTAGTQIRARIDADTVDQYSEAMQERDTEFPPVVVFHDDSEYILADGFHRVMAASRNGSMSITAEVRKGAKADALKFALGCNTAHGLRRTNADKRRAVELALAEWPKLSDRQIARVCAVSDHFAGDVRKSNCELNAVEQPRIGADGKERRLPVRKAPSVETPDESEPTERPRVVAGVPDEVGQGLHRFELLSRVERAYSRFVSAFDCEELPSARNMLRGLLAKSAEGDLE